MKLSNSILSLIISVLITSTNVYALHSSSDPGPNTNGTRCIVSYQSTATDEYYYQWWDDIKKSKCIKKNNQPRLNTIEEIPITDILGPNAVSGNVSFCGPCKMGEKSDSKKKLFKSTRRAYFYNNKQEYKQIGKAPMTTLNASVGTCTCDPRKGTRVFDPYSANNAYQKYP